MAMYYCDVCGNLRDCDHDPCEEIGEYDAVCTDCVANMEEDDPMDDGDYAHDNARDKRLEDEDGQTKAD